MAVVPSRVIVIVPAGKFTPLIFNWLPAGPEVAESGLRVAPGVMDRDAQALIPVTVLAGS